MYIVTVLLLGHLVILNRMETYQHLLQISSKGITRKSSAKEYEKEKKIILTSTILLACLVLAGCGNNQSAKSDNSSLRAENSSLKNSENVSIVGSYKDEQDGAAITLNSDGTGRYVYADPVNSDTDDQLTWKKDSDETYTITLQDSNVTSPLTGKLSGKMLTLSGDSNWNTETFRKLKII